MSTTSVRLALVAVLAMSWLASGPVFAQDEGGDDEPAPSADSQEVDEREAEFRRRMETGDSDRELDTDPSRPDLPDVVDMQPELGPIDKLPPDSREHLERRLTDLIIENGRWEPADAARETPYEPSEAAQDDPQLAAEEQAAWEEMVEAYNAREQAAWEKAGGVAGAAGPGSDGAGQGGGNGQGGNGQGGNGGQGGSGQGGGQSGATGAPAGAVAGREERPPEGKPFSAMDFLKGGDGSVGAEGEPATQEAAESASGTGTSGSAEGGPDARSAGPDSGAGEAAPEQPGDRRSQSSQGSTNEDPTGEPADESPAGDAVGAPAADVQDAAQAGGADGQGAGQDGSSGGQGEAAPPGSVSSEALEALFRQGSGTEPASSGGEQAGAPTDAGGESGTAAAPDTPGNPGSPGTPGAQGPPGTPAAQPPRGLFGWLMGLFAGDDDDAPETEDDPP